MPPKQKSVCKKHGKTGACKNHGTTNNNRNPGGPSKHQGTTNNNRNQGGPSKYQKPPCFNFQQYGECRFGTNCMYFHDRRFAKPPTRPSLTTSNRSSSQYAPPELPRVVCAQFRQTGNCWLGDSCQFKHERDSSIPEHREYTTVNTSDNRAQNQEGFRHPGIEDPTDTEALYRSWRQILGPKHTATLLVLPQELLPGQMERFLNSTFVILGSGAPETVQQMIGDIASEGGLRRLSQLADAEYILTDEPGTLKLSFKRHCVPFLKVMAHREMSTSLVLETEVGKIFRFLFGPDGWRAVNLFKRTSDTLVTLSKRETRTYIEEVLFAIGGVMLTTLNLNNSVKVQNQLKQIVTTLDRVLTGASNTNNYTFRLAEVELSRVKVLLRMTDAPPRPIRSQPRSSLYSSYQSPPLDVDLPGELSRHGPRHDNDHADISKIMILPTNDEIRSHRSEYIPQRALDYPHHLDGIARVIDFQFRLLREDTSGQIRLAIRNILGNWPEAVKAVAGWKPQARDAGARTIIHRNAICDKVTCTQKDGLVFNFQFDQPSKVAALSKAERKEWWENSKSMEVGALLCLLDMSGRSTFLIVSERIVSWTDTRTNSSSYVPGQEAARPVASNSNGHDLASDRYRAMATMKLACSLSMPDIQNLFKPTKVDQVLVEFPGLLFASFEPMLKCLQLVSKTGELAFTRWLAPSPIFRYTSQPASEYVDVPPPLYMTKPGASLALGAITGGKRLIYSTGANFHVADLKQKTTLDPGQCEALVASLSRELALIQGPPGTGKSYLGLQIVKVLLANRDTTMIGPIVCVCYTNHALDQFLEHLLEDGIKRIIRIGTRTKSEAVMPYTLHNVSRGTQRTRTEKDHMNEARRELDEHERYINSSCEQLLYSFDSNVLRTFLEMNYPDAFEQLFANVDESGYHRVGRGGATPTAHQVISDWTENRGFFYRKNIPTTNRPIEELMEANVYLMSNTEKLGLLESWYGEMRHVASYNLMQAADLHEFERRNLVKQRQEQDRRCLQKCHVIGLTTTGFAMNIDLIRSINAKVLICEEAGEVLEAHTLSTLLPTTEHAILIGDHQQLRPQIMNHDFSLENPRGGELYGLDTSLFERTAEVERFGGKRFPVARLDTQRRMYPSIADLVRNTLYSGLVDHPSTAAHPEVVGMARRLFWMNHRRAESGADKQDSTQMSHSNEFEADMVVQLVRYLSRQGVYRNGEIAVLSPYLRQLFVLQRKLSTMFDVIVGDSDQAGLDVMHEAPGISALEKTPTVKTGALLNEVRVATVDNFQGEEAKVIIISMVRSNKDRKCGFLRTSNRINVLLSRAKDGMYIFGNTETFSDVPMWFDVIRTLEHHGNIGEQLELRCPRHPGNNIRISEPLDFITLSPEGGCTRPCSMLNDCGHRCSKSCHSKLLHQSTVCLEPCERGYRFCGHRCPNPCGFPCGECHVPVPLVTLPCGHLPPSLLCHQLQKLREITCHTIVDEICPQGHRRQRQCWEDSISYQCTEACNSTLSCGHKCGGKCRICHKPVVEKSVTPILHPPCKAPCGKSLNDCSHKCLAYCHISQQCPPCDNPCGNSCVHGRCQKKCAEPCTPCTEECPWTCTHRSESCQKPCALPCGTTPCSKRCPKLLSCGHQCPSICGEKCPSQEFCQECTTRQVKGRRAGTTKGPSYSEIDLDIDPIIIPTCGHFYTLATFDTRMNIDTPDLTGLSMGPNQTNPPTKGTIPTRCLDCNEPLGTIHRYNNFIKPALFDHSARRLCVNTQKTYVKLAGQALREIEMLQSTNQDFINTQLPSSSNKKTAGGAFPKLVSSRVQRARDMWITLQRHIMAIDSQERPYLRLHEMTMAAQKGKNVQPTLSGDFSPIRCSIGLKAHCLLLDSRWATLWDMHLIAGSTFMAGPCSLTLRSQILTHLETAQTESSSVIEECVWARLDRLELHARIRNSQFVALYRLEHNTRYGLGKGKKQLSAQFNDERRQAELNSLQRCDELDGILSGSARLMQGEIDQTRGLLNGTSFINGATLPVKMIQYEPLLAELNPNGRWFTCPSGHPVRQFQSTHPQR